MGPVLFGFQRGQKPLLIRSGGSGSIEYPGSVRSEGLQQAGDQLATLAALHRGHADNGLWFAILQPPPANRRNQPLEIGIRRGLFAGELAGRDRVGRLTEGHDFAFDVSGGKAFRHVFSQRTAERAHAFEPDRPPVAPVRRGREEEQLPAALAPERHDLRKAVGRGMVGLVNEKSLAGEIRGQVLAREAVQGRLGTGKSVVERSWLAEVVDDPLYRPESAFPRPFD